MEEHYPDKYFNVIFPALYGVSYQQAITDGIIEPPEDELDDIEDIEDIPIEDEEHNPDELEEPQVETEEEEEEVI